MTDRAVSTTLSYVLTIAISTILVVGLLTAGSTFVSDQRDRVMESELRVIGQRLAADIATADRLVQASDDSTNVTVRSRLPDTVSGSPYLVRLVTEGDNASLELATTELDDDVTVPISNTTAIDSSTATNTRVLIVYDPATDRLEVNDGG